MLLNMYKFVLLVLNVKIKIYVYFTGYANTNISSYMT